MFCFCYPYISPFFPFLFEVYIRQYIVYFGKHFKVEDRDGLLPVLHVSSFVSLGKLLNLIPNVFHHCIYSTFYAFFPVNIGVCMRACVCV